MTLQVGIRNSSQLVGSLSGGQKRRVALAAALLASPDLIVADEPTNHMDHQVTKLAIGMCFPHLMKMIGSATVTLSTVYDGLHVYTWRIRGLHTPQKLHMSFGAGLDGPVCKAYYYIHKEQACLEASCRRQSAAIMQLRYCSSAGHQMAGAVSDIKGCLCSGGHPRQGLHGVRLHISAGA